MPCANVCVFVYHEDVEGCFYNFFLFIKVLYLLHLYYNRIISSGTQNYVYSL